MLKVLRVLKKQYCSCGACEKRLRQGSTIGFGDTVRSHFLKAEEIRQAAKARGVTRNPSEATQAMRRFQREAKQFIEDTQKNKKVQELQKKLKPRNKAEK